MTLQYQAPPDYLNSELKHHFIQGPNNGDTDKIIGIVLESTCVKRRLRVKIGTRVRSCTRARIDMRVETHERQNRQARRKAHK